MIHPLPGQTAVTPEEHARQVEERAREQWARVAEYQRRATDEHGFYHGVFHAVPQVIEDEVPDNAHWKGWVW